MPRIACESGEKHSPSARIRASCTWTSTAAIARSDGDLPARIRSTVTYGDMPVLDGGGSLSLQIYAAVFGLHELPGLLRHHLPESAVRLRRRAGRLLRARPEADRRHGLRALHQRPLPQVVPGVPGRARRGCRRADVDRVRDGQGGARPERDPGCGAPQAARRRVRRTPMDQLSQEERDLVDGARATSCRRRATIDTEIRRLDNRIVNLESFFNQMIEIERDYGIQSFGYFR